MHSKAVTEKNNQVDDDTRVMVEEEMSTSFQP